MGCSQSKIENKESISRCQERKAFMEFAVAYRNLVATGHWSYAIWLKNAGAALSDFAEGEVANSLSLPTGPPPPKLGIPVGPIQSPAPPPPPVRDLPPPPPPIPDMPQPLQRAVSMPEFVVQQPGPKPVPEDTIQEEDEEDEDDNDDDDNEVEEELDRLRRKRRENNKGGSVGDRMESTPTSINTGTSVMSPPSVKKGKQVVGQGGEGRRKSSMNVNLVQIFSDLDDCFLKASENAYLVSKMLEATRWHYHSNFADNRGHIDHSTRVMRVITWIRSFRGLANAEEYKDDFDSEENKTHATVFDKLLASEKKLYVKVKAGELMKVEYQRKVALLNKQKKRGTNAEALEKAKAAVSNLHTRYIVDMQSLDSTVSEISRLRDEQLYPKLVAVVDAMATMWEAMQEHHENQLKIASHLRLIDISQSTKETTDHHHDRTLQLWNVVKEWHFHFEKMVNHQKDYIKALNSWLKLNLIPIESCLKEKISSHSRPRNPPIQGLLLAWHDHLEKLPDEHAKSVIVKFAAVLVTIVQQQHEEMRLRAIMEESRRDLDKKQHHYNKWLHKYMQKKTANEDADPASIEEEFVHKDEIMVEKEFVVENAKKKVEEDTENYERHCAHVREKSLASLKNRLPELFRAFSEFALSASDMYSNLKGLCPPSQGRKHK